MGFLSGLLDPGNIFGGNEGGISISGIFDPVGAALGGAGVMPDFYDKATGTIDDWAGDLYDFERSQLSDWAKRFKNDPTQLLIGAGDPFSAKMWGKITGKEYDPYVNQWGGPTEDAYRSAEEKGVDTSNSRGSHQIAQSVASYYGGGALGALGGAAGTATGIGAGAGQALTGAAVGGAGSWANGGNFWDGAVQGGLGGLLGQVDYGGMAGVDNPLYRRTLNGAIGGGLSAGATGENVGQGALMGAGKGAASGLYGMYAQPDESIYDLPGTVGGTQQDEFGESSATMGGEIMPVQISSNNQRAQALSAGGGTAASSPVDSLIQALSVGAQKMGGLENLSTLAGQAMGLYDASRQRRRAREQADALNNLYSANSPYAQQMRQRLERQDAAAGRRSQIGTRETELAARMADTQARMAPQLNQLYNQENAARNRMLSNGLRMGSGLYKLYNQP